MPRGGARKGTLGREPGRFVPDHPQSSQGFAYIPGRKSKLPDPQFPNGMARPHTRRRLCAHAFRAWKRPSPASEHRSPHPRLTTHRAASKCPAIGLSHTPSQVQPSPPSPATAVRAFVLRGPGAGWLLRRRSRPIEHGPRVAARAATARQFLRYSGMTDSRYKLSTLGLRRSMRRCAHSISKGSV